MADYIYLLENRLSHAQKNALSVVREIAREKGLTVFLVGGAVRDLTSGSPVRDLDVAVQGNALKLKQTIEKSGGVITGENVAGQALFVRFPGSVRVEIGSTLSVSYPKPGKPSVQPATILDDLRRRDFTANAMALSLNEGSYGLLMDPLNGVADIENRELRLVSNYGFIEDPIRMVRAARLMARLGWQMDEKTQSRYETGKEEGYISAASDFQRGYESEEIVHEEDPLRVLRRLESEGWMKILAPAWTTAKVNVTELEKMHESQMQLQLQGIHADPSSGNFPLLTAKMSVKEIAELKKSFPRQGFVAEIEALEGEAKEFAAQFSGKLAALPSQAWKMLHAAKPEAVLAVAYSSKSASIQAKFKNFYTEWPKARQRVPYTLMQEMRITPELPGYAELVDEITFALMDGRLSTPEEMKAFLEPHSPPAPPPTVHVRRPRASKKDAKQAKGRAKKAAMLDEDGEEVDEDLEDAEERENAAEDLDEDTKDARDSEDLDDDTDEEDEAPVVAPKATPVAKPTPVKAVAEAAAVKKPVVEKAVPVPAAKVASTVAVSKTVAKPAPPKPIASKPAVVTAVAKSAPVVKKAVPAKAAKAVPAKKPVVAKKAAPVKTVAKKAVPPVKVAKTATKHPVPAKKVVPTKVVAKKAASAPAKAAKNVPAKRAIVAKKAVAKKAVVAKKAAVKGHVVKASSGSVKKKSR